jgi:hypothetical protein
MFHAIIRILKKNVLQLLLQTVSLDTDKSNRNEPVKLTLKKYHFLLNSSLRIRLNVRAKRQLIQCVSSFRKLYAAHTVRKVLSAVTSIYGLYNASIHSCYYTHLIQCVRSPPLHAVHTIRELLPEIIRNLIQCVSSPPLHAVHTIRELLPEIIRTLYSA